MDLKNYWRKQMVNNKIRELVELSLYAALIIVSV